MPPNRPKNQRNFLSISDLASKKRSNQKSSVMPCPSTGPRMFCADPNFLGQTKN
jgi:hypothetical protein